MRTSELYLKQILHLQKLLFCLREGFKDVGKSNSDMYRSDNFLDEGCELENKCLSILNEVLVEKGVNVNNDKKGNICGRCEILGVY